MALFRYSVCWTAKRILELSNIQNSCNIRLVGASLMTGRRVHDSQPQIGEGIDERWFYDERRTKNESLENRRARLLYQSRKRGILENDLLLATFAAKYLPSMTVDELDQYDFLINTISNEWDIYYYAVGTKDIPECYQNSIMDKLTEHARNEKREERLRQPDL